MEMRIWKWREKGFFCRRTDGFWKVARGHHQNVLFMLEFVELCQKRVDDLRIVNVLSGNETDS